MMASSRASQSFSEDYARAGEDEFSQVGGAAGAEEEEEEVEHLRIYAGKGIVSPGSTYKAVRCPVNYTSKQLIQATLERFGMDSSNPDDFYLTFNEPKKTMAQNASAWLLGSGRRKKHTLRSDEVPVLVLDWYTDRGRKFEIHRKNALK
eukprot:m.42308 g.42308  ORF g.42308 m.42308 type:complete len:149 (-) comp14327_c0_seq1:92-538(-)